MVLETQKVGRLSTKKKSDAYFDIYWSMGLERSLEKLHNLLGDLGVKISVTTLSNYSSAYDWQGRLREIDETQRIVADKDKALKLLEMNDRQADLGESMVRMSGRMMQRVKERLEASPNRMVVSPTDAARWLTDGSKVERLARGAATERTEARVAYSLIVEQVFDAFAVIAKEHELPQSAIEAFVSATDDIVTTALESGAVDE